MPVKVDIMPASRIASDKDFKKKIEKISQCIIFINQIFF